MSDRRAEEFSLDEILPGFICPPDLDLGPGTIWLKTLQPEDYACHPHSSRQEVLCELFLVCIDEVSNNTVFANEDMHELHASVYIPINSGIPEKYRISPTVIVDQWSGWREWPGTPEWTKWTPGTSKSFVECRSVVAKLFGLCSTHPWNRDISESIWEWSSEASIGTEAEEAFHSGENESEEDFTMVDDSVESMADLYVKLHL
ncbi:hypothetical protein OE88DRAFT_1736612 [Heliocybe sulcata]|uniref:Uncharacterized protein n=1 Tax=Heliocybe sulcata TaxID=5364 RepID=A0A5C3N0M2_9AGAM|nr:hypothetical protein OE88DRAFT_1736612 [Heliocybe sulcata]